MSDAEDLMVSRTVYAPVSIDERNRTVEVIFSAGTRGRNFLPGVGVVLEELDMSPNAVRMETLLSGNAPVLDTHRQNEVRSVLGRVVSARLSGGRGYATLKISEADDVKPIWQRIVDGTLRHVSVGYSAKYEAQRASGGETVYRAIDWEPREISFCAIPVDPQAGVRSGGADAPGYEVIPIPADASAQVRAAEAPLASGNVSTPPQESRMADPTVPESPAAPTIPPVVAPPVDLAAVRAEAEAAERARVTQIERVVASTRAIVGDEADTIRANGIEAGHTADQVRAALLDAAVARGSGMQAPLTPVSQTGRSYDSPNAVIDAMATALAVRAMPALAGQHEEQKWREFADLRPSDMLIELAAARGERVSPRDRSRLIERAFHTTSDFPMLLENAGNKMLEAGYQAAAPTYRQFFAQRSFNDFKAHSFLTAGDFPALAELAEGGAITAGTISEKRERITPKTYARQVRVTRQMLVNDDLGAFADFGTMIGRRVADYENALAFALVNTASGDGPTLSTGSAAVFGTGATRANKASAGTAITETALDLGHAAMMSQTGLDGIKLNIQPAILLTGAAYRGAAIRYTTRVSPESGANVGLYSNLTPIADANITGNRWYLFAAPGSAPVYVYGYVGGQTGPMIRVHQYVPGTDGMAVEVVHDFAVGAIDHRGGYFNPGA